MGQIEVPPRKGLNKSLRGSDGQKVRRIKTISTAVRATDGKKLSNLSKCCYNCLLGDGGEGANWLDREGMKDTKGESQKSQAEVFGY